MACRLEILRQLEAGQIDAEEAARLLAELPEVAEAGETIRVTERPAGLPQERWAHFWIYPLMVGGGLLMLGTLLMALVYATVAARGWLVCGWPMMVLGLLAVVLSLWSRWAKWLHVRIREKGGKRIAISFPLPLTLTSWVLRVIGPFVPQLRDTGVDDLLIALRDSKRGEPLHVQVDEGEDGDQVEVYIG